MTQVTNRFFLFFYNEKAIHLLTVSQVIEIGNPMNSNPKIQSEHALRHSMNDDSIDIC